MRRIKWTTKMRLIRNGILIVLLLLLVWIAAGTPALTAKGAFRRAMQENLTPQVQPEVVIRHDRVTAILGKDRDVWYQVAVNRKWLIFWQHYSEMTETEDTENVCIVPLLMKEMLLYGGRSGGIYYDKWRVPDMAVRAQGASAALSVTVDGYERALDFEGIQDGWFCFSFVRDPVGPNNYNTFVEDCRRYMDGELGIPADPHGCFTFESYDESGNVLQKGSREF